MHRVALLLCALALCGCNEIVGAGRYRVGDAGGGFDGATPDGGRGDAGDAGRGADGCVLRDWYRDRDGDDFGDPETSMRACAQPEGFVETPGDCDDRAMDVNPDGVEACDSVDQDCDGAFDEGLFGPLEPLIVVEPDFGFGGGQSAATVAYEDGFAVVWKSESENVVRASFYDWDGTPVREREFIDGRVPGGVGPDVRSPTATSYSRDGIDQFVIIYLTPDEIRAELCSSLGCGSDFLVLGADTTDVERLRAQQLGSYVLLVWDTPMGASALAFDPSGGARSEVVDLPRGSAEEVEFGAVGVIGGSSPTALVSRIGTPADPSSTPLPPAGSWTQIGEATLIRLVGDMDLRVDAEGSYLWDATSACDRLATPFCRVIPAPIGRRGAPAGTFHVIEGAVGGDDGPTFQAEQCVRSVRMGTDDELVLGDCTPFDATLVAAAGRDGVVTLVHNAGTSGDYVVREEPRDAATEGTPPSLIPGIDLLMPGTGLDEQLSTYGSRGVVIGSGTSGSGFDVVAVRLGCGS